MLLFPHMRNHRRVTPHFLFQEEPAKGERSWQPRLLLSMPSHTPHSTSLSSPSQMRTATQPAGPWLIWTTIPLHNLQLTGISKQCWARLVLQQYSQNCLASSSCCLLKHLPRLRGSTSSSLPKTCMLTLYLQNTRDCSKETFITFGRLGKGPPKMLSK